MKNSLIQHLTQILLIVFSVVLGLYLSERIEERKNNNEAKKLLSTVLSEVRDNHQILEDWAPYHRQIATRLGSLSNDQEFINSFIEDRTVLYDKIFTEGTFMSTMPTDDAWDIAKSHPLIVNLDYHELLILSKIYNQQKSTFEPTEKISDLFFSPDFNAADQAQDNLLTFNNRMQEVASREQQLLEYFAEAQRIFEHSH